MKSKIHEFCTRSSNFFTTKFREIHESYTRGSDLFAAKFRTFFNRNVETFALIACFLANFIIFSVLDFALQGLYQDPTIGAHASAWRILGELFAVPTFWGLTIALKYKRDIRLFIIAYAAIIFRLFVIATPRHYDHTDIMLLEGVIVGHITVVTYQLIMCSVGVKQE